ncbi:type II toxin-antitoxin system HicA family toxin [Castellaniella sp. GW247-6E4]|uniref:type II toxin-antitoxin system HicA family toxin n=1 Tax=Castellaniella sp. GW247-6E4 TaxID=3140380 RepID=UPI00331646E2
MEAKQRRALELIFSRPTPAGVKCSDAASLFAELGAEISEREGSRVAVFLFGQVKVMHRPHPSPDMDKGAVASVRKWLEENGVKP